MKKIKREENNCGITLVALIITVSILIIIAGIGISSGIETTDSIKVRSFNDELQLIQARVDVLYEQIQVGEKTEADFGGASYTDRQAIMDRTLNEVTDKIGEAVDFKYYTSQGLENYLGVEDINQSVLINWKTREVISVEGIKIDGVRRYKYTGSYQQEYKEEKKNIKILSEIEPEGDLKKIKVSVRDATNDEPISNFILKYKLSSDEVWKIADYDYFYASTPGKYQIQVSGNKINTLEADVTLESV